MESKPSPAVDPGAEEDNDLKDDEPSLLRLIFGRRLRTAEANQERVKPFRGLALLGLDALGSASYGPEAALSILIPAGIAGLAYIREVTAAILVLLFVLFFSYRQTIAAYPNGGGSYTVARENLGKNAGLAAASSLLLDYLLNVAVGISAGVGALQSAFPFLQSHTLAACLALLAVITIVNLRGVRDSGVAWSFPTYIFVCALLIVVAIGVVKSLTSGGHPTPVTPLPSLRSSSGPVGFWLILRAFASGCTAMTGVEAVSNAVPVFSEPSVKNAKRTLGLICLLLGSLLGGIGYLAQSYQIGALSQEKAAYQSVISQIASAVVGRGPLYYIVIGSTLAVLALSANTSFAAFPRLCRLLAEDRYLPASFASLGRRLVYSYGIIILAVLSAILLIIFGGITDRLIPLFAVGAFGAFTMSQAGMVMHWRRQGCEFRSLSFLINACGALITGTALLIIIIAKFSEGAWITVLIIPSLFLTFVRVRRHYAKLLRETRAPLDVLAGKTMPLKVIIPIEGWNRMAERALRFAPRISEDITAIHVTSQETNESLIAMWRAHVEMPLKRAGVVEPRLEIIQSPYRTLFQPLIEYIRCSQRKEPDRLIAVVIPELIRPRWWEYLLHNHVAAALRTNLLLTGNEGVIIITTPWYLRPERSATGGKHIVQR